MGQCRLVHCSACLMSYPRNSVVSGIDMVSTNPTALGVPVGQKVPQMYRILKFVLGLLGFDSILLTRSCILGATSPIIEGDVSII
jgi:hypothetical protein